VVSPLRENLSACLIFPSMPEVMRLNKVGRERGREGGREGGKEGGREGGRRGG